MKTNNQVLEALEKILANSYGLSVKLQNYHWNVVGSDFKPLHEMLGSQYENLSEAIDEIAERMRALGTKVEASFEHFSSLSKISKSDKNLSAKEMLKDVLDANKFLVDLMKSGIVICQENRDEASADMLIGRVHDHEKMMWMITSTIS